MSFALFADNSAACDMRFHKYHALGNDYIVMDPADFPGLPASGGAKGDQRP